MAEIKSLSSNTYNKHLLEWNKHSDQILLVTSTVFIGYKQGKTESKILDTTRGTMGYLGTSMSSIDKEISNLY